MPTTRKLLKRLNAMLDNALCGRPIESGFDESQVSQMESKLHRVLLQNHTHKQQLLEEKTRVSRLISDISHQTKTPLANISLYSELLAECDDETTREKYNQLLSSQTEKLQFLIGSLVKISRLESGIITLSPKVQSVQNLYCNLQKSFTEVCFSKEDFIACYDIKWTAEAVSNLLDNAKKYGASEILVAVHEYEFFCKIDVCDNGWGIAQEDIPKVFQRFYRAENTRETEGVGIGLYLARQIVTRQGGYMKLASTLGKGSVFSIFLPKTE